MQWNAITTEFSIGLIMMKEIFAAFKKYRLREDEMLVVFSSSS